MSTWLAGLGALSKGAAEGVIQARELRRRRELDELHRRIALLQIQSYQQDVQRRQQEFEWRKQQASLPQISTAALPGGGIGVLTFDPTSRQFRYQRFGAPDIKASDYESTISTLPQEQQGVARAIVDMHLAHGDTAAADKFVDAIARQHGRALTGEEGESALIQRERGRPLTAQERLKLHQVWSSTAWPTYRQTVVDPNTLEEVTVERKVPSGADLSKLFALPSAPRTVPSAMPPSPARGKPQAPVPARPPTTKGDRLDQALRSLGLAREQRPQTPTSTVPTGTSPTGGAAPPPGGFRDKIDQIAYWVANGQQKLTGMSRAMADAVTARMIEHGWKPQTATAAKQSQTLTSLRLIDVSIHGDQKAPVGDYRRKGLADYLYVLDNEDSRYKLAAVLGSTPAPEYGIIGRETLAMAMRTLTPDEKNFYIQYRRAVAAIQGLRQVTGLPRATQTLFAVYQLELPGPWSADSSMGRDQISAIDREVEAARETTLGPLFEQSLTQQTPTAPQTAP